MIIKLKNIRLTSYLTKTLTRRIISDIKKKTSPMILMSNVQEQACNIIQMA